MSWTPRSQRLGKSDYDGPFDGTPSHLLGPLLDWLESMFMYQGYWQGQIMRPICIRLRIPIAAGASDGAVFEAMKGFASQSTDRFWDVIEGALQSADVHDAEALRELLALGGSTLTVGHSNRELTEVVGPEMNEIARLAMSSSDGAAEQLAEAWTHAFGRNPDPSDAWDHAIKAVEAILRPTVEPNNGKATLGSTIAVLNNNPAGWKAVFPGSQDNHDVSNLIGTLRLIWPNTDRHGGGGRAPSLQEARAVVTLATTIVQWHREGFVLHKR